MSALSWVSGMIGQLGVVLSGQACPLPPEPVVEVRTVELPMQQDFDKNGAEIRDAANNDVLQPIKINTAALGGLMNIELTADTNVQFGGADARKGPGACVWPGRIEITIKQAGTLYVNKTFPPGSCMHDAIAAHEMEHYNDTRQMVSGELSNVRKAALEAARKLGAVGPMSAEQARQQGKPIGDAITAVVRGEIDRLNKQQKDLQIRHDNPIENVEVMSACRGPGRFIYTEPQLPPEYR